LKQSGHEYMRGSSGRIRRFDGGPKVYALFFVKGSDESNWPTDCFSNCAGSHLRRSLESRMGNCSSRSS